MDIPSSRHVSTQERADESFAPGWKRCFFDTPIRRLEQWSYTIEKKIKNLCEISVGTLNRPPFHG